MAQFVLFMLVSAAWGLFFAWRKPPKMNQLLIRCSACGSKLYRRPISKRWRFTDMMAWSLIAWVVVWRHGFHGFVTIALILLLVIVWSITTKRLVHAYWMWRHPLRCQGGGHIAPVPQGT